MNPFAGRSGNADTENRFMDGAGVGPMREKHGNIYATVCGTDSGNLLYDSGTLCQPRGVDGGRG